VFWPCRAHVDFADLMRMALAVLDRFEALEDAFAARSTSAI
jgi:predicted nicotinamide N-methyase